MSAEEVPIWDVIEEFKEKVLAQESEIKKRQDAVEALQSELEASRPRRRRSMAGWPSWSLVRPISPTGSSASRSRSGTSGAGRRRSSPPARSWRGGRRRSPSARIR
jgi:hypothetical protein